MVNIIPINKLSTTTLTNVKKKNNQKKLLKSFLKYSEGIKNMLRMKVISVNCFTIFSQ